ncbi:hypothetical protein B0H67DRAFT_647401 [Lasiosphaeris hirsuta]|uniref:Uncharacterized protein n=1 Tax=Lasiosphaeris hirsuta TaxID=260670 RepID=A0AA40AA43_9PEZI|nr:hypothetical protein B0H67DRAFT_647401 [Lasiosphaeris hirsuta]
MTATRSSPPFSGLGFSIRAARQATSPLVHARNLAKPTRSAGSRPASNPCDRSRNSTRSISSMASSASSSRPLLAEHLPEQHAGEHDLADELEQARRGREVREGVVEVREAVEQGAAREEGVGGEEVEVEVERPAHGPPAAAETGRGPRMYSLLLAPLCSRMAGHTAVIQENRKGPWVGLRHQGRCEDVPRGFLLGLHQRADIDLILN